MATPIIQDSRMLTKRSTSTGIVPSIAPSTNHLDGSWVSTDIYKGEFFVNLVDDKFWFRSDNGIIEGMTVKRQQQGSTIYGVATGTNTYAVTLTPAPTAYVAGMMFNIKFTNANTGASTLNVNSLGAKTLVRDVSSALSSGDILSGGVYTVVYDGTNFQVSDVESDGGSSTFIGLTDVPASYTSQALKQVRVNAGATALEFVTPAFTLLSDVPSSYSGQALKSVRVNAGATGLEFFTPASAVTGIGTTGRLTKWSSSGVLSDSLISESGSQVIINGTGATLFLGTAGSAYLNTPSYGNMFTYNSSAPALIIGDDASGTEIIISNADNYISLNGGSITYSALSGTHIFNGYLTCDANAAIGTNILGGNNILELSSITAYTSQIGLQMTVLNETATGGNVLSGLDLTTSHSASGSTGTVRMWAYKYTAEIYGGNRSYTAGNFVNTRLQNTISAFYPSSGTPTIADSYLIRLLAPAFASSVKPTTVWGLEIANQGVSGVTTSYAIDIKAQSASTNNYAIVSAANNKHGLGTTAPTATVHIGAGTTTLAPLKLSSGTNLTTAEAGAIEYDGTYLFATNSGVVRQQILQNQISRVTTQEDQTTTTLASSSFLTSNVVAGKIYYFEAILFVDASAGGGSKFAIGGTATATSIIYEIVMIDNTLNTNTITSRQTTIGGSAGQTGTTSGFCVIRGTIVVNAGGTLAVQFAQNAASGTSSLLINSTFRTTQWV